MANTDSKKNDLKAELKKIVGRVKTAQDQLETLLKDRTWIEEARKYAERQGKEVRKLITGDVGKVRTFLERERKELERFQKQLPGEVQKLRKFVDGQKAEFEKLLVKIRKGEKKQAKAARAAGKKSAGTKRKKSSAKKAESSSASSSN